MADVVSVGQEVPTATTPVRKKVGRGFWARPGSISLVVGCAIFVAVLLGAIFAPLLTPWDPIRNDIRVRNVPPVFLEGGQLDHPLGTDSLGRDILSRLLFGARMSLILSTAGVMVSLCLGVVAGMLAGFLGKRVDFIIMRVVDLQMAFPFILLAIAIVSATEASVPTLVILLGLAGWPGLARVVRGVVIQEQQKDYVKAARVVGASPLRVALKYVMPNAVPLVVVIATLQLAWMILFESTLSFLGMGIKPPTPSWGGMMLEGQTYMATAWWITALPGVAIFITTLSLNVASDSLRDALDPRLQVT